MAAVNQPSAGVAGGIMMDHGDVERKPCEFGGGGDHVATRYLPQHTGAHMGEMPAGHCLPESDQPPSSDRCAQPSRVWFGRNPIEVIIVGRLTLRILQRQHRTPGEIEYRL